MHVDFRATSGGENTERRAERKWWTYASNLYTNVLFSNLFTQ